jgi:hypothetical protein
MHKRTHNSSNILRAQNESHYQTISNLFALWNLISHFYSFSFCTRRWWWWKVIMETGLLRSLNYPFVQLIILHTSFCSVGPNSFEMKAQINIQKLHWLWFRHKHNTINTFRPLYGRNILHHSEQFFITRKFFWRLNGNLFSTLLKSYKHVKNISSTRIKLWLTYSNWIFYPQYCFQHALACLMFKKRKLWKLIFCAKNFVLIK